MTYREEQILINRIEKIEKHLQEQAGVLDNIKDKLSNLGIE